MHDFDNRRLIIRKGLGQQDGIANQYVFACWLVCLLVRTVKESNVKLRMATSPPPSTTTARNNYCNNTQTVRETELQRKYTSTTLQTVMSFIELMADHPDSGQTDSGQTDSGQMDSVQQVAVLAADFSSWQTDLLHCQTSKPQSRC